MQFPYTWHSFKYSMKSLVYTYMGIQVLYIQCAVCGKTGLHAFHGHIEFILGRLNGFCQMNNLLYDHSKHGKLF